MKKAVFLILAILLIACPCAVSFAQTAEDITLSAGLSATAGERSLSGMLDSDYATSWAVKDKGALTIHLPDDQPCFGLYISFSRKQGAFAVEVMRDGQWQTLTELPSAYYNQFIELKGETFFRLSVKKGGMSISSLKLFGEGALPAFVETWQPPCEKADLMLLVAHPDDELLWFGGLLPAYAGERGLAVQVVYMTSRAPVRRNELLDGLWHCGVRNYPVMGVYADFFTKNKQDVYKSWGNRDVVAAYIASLLRIYRPEVLVTQAKNGEYGHAMHRVLADLCPIALNMAADDQLIVGKTAALPPWQVKKLYLHLYDKNQITMDWGVPLSAFEQKTGLQIAEEAFQMHVSQQATGYRIEPFGKNDCRLFGLKFSCVGEDKEKSDFMENIPGR